MEIILFFLNSILLGAALAMDAFSVSITNAMRETNMKKGRMCCIAGVYAFFQFAMPLIGWFCVHTIATIFVKFTPFIPWIALLLLGYIGGQMIREGIKSLREGADSGATEEEDGTTMTEEEGGTNAPYVISFSMLIMQGVATAIDALSVGFTIADYGVWMALGASLIIAVVTFVICMGGLVIGRKVGAVLSNRATIVGGIILIGIGLEIFIKGVFF